MGVTTDKINKPFNPRGNDQSPKGYNRASLFSGKALDFDGVNDVVNITTNDLNFGANDFSVSAIVDWSGGHKDGKLAYAERGSSGSELAAWQIRTDGSGNILFQANTAADGWQAVYFSGVEAIIADGLTHLTFVRVGTGVTLYINGVFYSTGTSSIQATLDTPNGAFVIGNRIGANEYWNGLVSNFKVFSGALTAAQVADLYNNPEKVVPTGVADSALKLWLPMMEGAGTTAYDGSGNGNHGTISGATYEHGIGAPVAQTAVIDWNKGSNILTHSEDFTNAIYLQAGSGAIAPVRTANQATAPDGQLTADKIVFPAVSGTNNLSVVYRDSVSLSGAHNSAIYLKGENGGEVVYLFYLIGGPTTYYTQECTLTTEWQRFDIDFTGGSISYWHLGVDLRTGSGQVAQSASTIYAWGTNTNTGSLGPYIPTLSTAQTSEVLLPQGLTTGRDITGVNLFENVRKQGALNLDGNSWAEVHDNASVDLTTDFSLEVWCYPTKEGTSNGRELIGKFISSSAPYQCWALEYKPNKFGFGIGATDNTWEVIGSTTGKTKENWYHVVATYDGATRKIYINGVQDVSGNYTKTPQTTDENIAIGRWLGEAIGGNNTFFGPIAQPRIYNRALTAEEVQRSYDSNKNTYTNS